MNLFHPCWNTDNVLVITNFYPFIPCLFVCFMKWCWKTTHLTRNRSAAGVRHSAALGAGVFLRTIKVQVPGPVGVVVPPATLKLSKGEQSTGKCTLFILLCTMQPACLGFYHGKSQPHSWCQYVQMEEGKPHEGFHRGTGNVCVFNLSCGKCSPRPKAIKIRPKVLWVLGSVLRYIWEVCNCV